MNRGYIKFWRKAQDSSSWNRGLMYQGLIVNLLCRAAWKKGSYQGRDILPGQFGVVLGLLADSLKVPKTTLHRMVSHLVEDGLLTVENVGNRFSLITIVNWHCYQGREDDAWNADGTPMEHQRNARGTPSYKEEEVKKEEKTLSTQESLVNQDHARALNVAGGETVEHFTAEQLHSGIGDEPSIEFAELREFWDRECRAEGPLTGWQEYKQLKAARQWPGMGRIAQDVEQRARAGTEPGYFPSLVRYLRERYWLAEVKTGPKKAPRASPRAPTVFQQNMQHFDDFATRELASRGIHLPGGLEHGHAGDDFTQAIDVGCRVRDNTHPAEVGPAGR